LQIYGVLFISSFDSQDLLRRTNGGRRTLDEVLVELFLAPELSRWPLSALNRARRKSGQFRRIPVCFDARPFFDNPTENQWGKIYGVLSGLISVNFEFFKPEQSISSSLLSSTRPFHHNNHVDGHNNRIPLLVLTAATQESLS
jgi:hypothetical protein